MQQVEENGEGRPSGRRRGTWIVGHVAITVEGGHAPRDRSWPASSFSLSKARPKFRPRLQVQDLINFRGTLFYFWPQVFRPLGQGGHVGFGAKQRRRSEAI